MSRRIILIKYPQILFSYSYYCSYHILKTINKGMTFVQFSPPPWMYLLGFLFTLIYYCHPYPKSNISLAVLTIWSQNIFNEWFFFGIKVLTLVSLILTKIESHLYVQPLNTVYLLNCWQREDENFQGLQFLGKLEFVYICIGYFPNYVCSENLWFFFFFP